MVRDSYKLKLINPSGSLKRKEIVIIRRGGGFVSLGEGEAISLSSLANK